MNESELMPVGGDDSSTDDGKVVLIIPKNQSQAVVDFVASLQQKDAEVSGYMFGGSMFGGGGNRVVVGPDQNPLPGGGSTTGTHCTTWMSHTITGTEADGSCADVDHQSSI
jgi:hypothetical protein